MTIKPTSDAVAVTGAEEAEREARRRRRFHESLHPARPMTEGESGERCHDCGGFYETVYRVPDDVWAKIAPDKAALGEHEEHRYGGLLCLPCADRRAREKGIRLYFDASVGDWRPMTEDVAGLVLQLRTRAEACRKANLHKDAHLHDKAADALTALSAKPEAGESARYQPQREAVLEEAAREVLRLARNPGVAAGDFGKIAWGQALQRLEAALTTPAPAVSRDDQALFNDICDNMAEVLKPLPGEE